MKKPPDGANRREAFKHRSLDRTGDVHGKTARVKESRPFAAVYDDADTRADTVAKVIPANASQLTVGNAVLGYWYQPSDLKRLPKSWKMVMVKQRYNELARLVKYRRAYNLDPGPPIGWAVVLADLEAAFGREVNVDSVSDLCRRLRLPLIDEDIVAGVAHATEVARRVWSSYSPINSTSVGALLLVTTVEREDCQLKRIDAADEPSADRKRRLAKERMRKLRQRKAAAE